MVGFIVNVAIWLFKMGLALGFLFVALFVFLIPIALILGSLGFLDDTDDNKKKRKF